MLNVINISEPTVYYEGSEIGMPCIVINFSPYGDPISAIDIYRQIVKLTKYEHMLIVFAGHDPLKQDHEDLTHLMNMLRNKKYLTLIETEGFISAPVVIKLADYVSCTPGQVFDECNIDWYEVDSLKFRIPNQTPKILMSFLDYINEDTVLPCDNFYMEPVINKHYAQNLNAALSEIYDLGYPWKLLVSIKTDDRK